MCVWRHLQCGDARVLVIDKPRTGVSDARNRGMDAAKGVYLQFVDCDDLLTPNASEKLALHAEKTGAHLVIADYYRVVGDIAEVKGGITADGVLSRREYLTHMMENPANFYFGVMWNKLYRREIIEKHRLRCSTELDWCEDLLFNLSYIGYADSFAAIQTPVYYYIKNQHGLVGREATLSNSIKMKKDLFAIYKQLIDENDLYQSNRIEVTKFLVAYAKDGGINRKLFRKKESIPSTARRMLAENKLKRLSSKAKGTNT